MSTEKTYTVSVYATPMCLPFIFTIHSWVEISDGETTDRYDVWAYPGYKTSTAQKGFIHQNIFPNHLGTTISPFAKTDSLDNRQAGKIIAEISGAPDSLAHLLHDAIKEQAFFYPAPGTFRLFRGPNCNTYTQWLLQLVPGAGMSLPWYAWGREGKLT